ncbi:MAG: type I restriction-modification system subunit M N-terminal domain-containing protein [Janthinobacterium lividum]
MNQACPGIYCFQQQPGWNMGCQGMVAARINVRGRPLYSDQAAPRDSAHQSWSAVSQARTYSMTIKKSDLYSSIWSSCDDLRGSMDARQYKDYVLFLLFIKYISDKYGSPDAFASPITIPVGASFADMVALKGDPQIGEKINTQVIQPLVEANAKLARNDFPDFNDPNKLGEGQAKVERLSNLIAIFQKPELNLSQNRAEHAHILGDAYEYPMRHFATESGKSKGQFYTPSEGQPDHGEVNAVVLDKGGR